MLLVVGQILRPHGVRGEVIVQVRTDEPRARFAPASVLRTATPATGHTAVAPAQGDTAALAPGDTTLAPAPGDTTLARAMPARLTVQWARPHQDRLIVAFEGIEDRAAAEELRGIHLCVESADLSPPEDPDEYHDFQLVGLAAVDSRRERLGEVIGVEHGPGSERLVVRLTSGKRVLVPFVHAIVAEVDLVAGYAVITPPAGLFEL